MQAAKIIAQELGTCELRLITTYNEACVPTGYDRIGFVYPVYAGLPPRCVQDFIINTDFSANADAYYYQVMTYGGSSGNSCWWVNEQMKRKNITLSASYGVHGKPNYIVSYPISKDGITKAVKARKTAKSIGRAVCAKEKTKLQSRPVKLFSVMNRHIAPPFALMDSDYSVSDSCIGCGICSHVCPVENICMVNGKPEFKHRCEQCMSCIHNCPQHAINYKNVTVNRNRYRNPDISLQELFRK